MPKHPALRCSILLIVAFAGVLLFSCQKRSEAPPAKYPWTAGFWFWGHGEVSPGSPTSVDVVFCQVGTLRPDVPTASGRWAVHGSLPEKLPLASEYWVVFRSEMAQVPPVSVSAGLTSALQQLRGQAVSRRLNLRGVQLDIDVPTSALHEYAGFLKAIRKDLPPGFEVSITALLDWFRPGTPFSEVAREVDEFVPQFYDVGGNNREYRIASPFTAARWGSVFNQFRKRYRIGVSTFGRARFTSLSAGPGRRLSFFKDLRPLDLGLEPAFRLEASRNGTEELVLRYTASRPVILGWQTFAAGEGVEFVMATPDTVRTAVNEAKAMIGYCAGVLFFRWPAYREVLAMPPDDVLAATGVIPSPPVDSTRVDARDGGCAAVHCVDLYLSKADRLISEPRQYRIRSSSDLEYFVPAERIPARLSSPAEISVSLPPYGAHPHLYLGRAVAAKPADYHLEVVP